MLNYRVYTGFTMLLLLMQAVWGAEPLVKPTPVISATGSPYPYTTSISTAQSLDVSVTMTVDQVDVGKKAAVYIVAYTSNQWFMLDSNSTWSVWNYPDLQSLVPNRSDYSLAAENTLVIAKQLNGFKGVGDIYIGYKVDGGDYRYNTEPVTFNSFTQQLNDTGVKTCANNTQTGLPCPVPDFPGQDADNQIKINQSKYTKIAADGSIPDSTATVWSCVKDNISGLWWEAKKDSTVNDLQKQDNLYTWYNSNINNNGGSDGVKNGGGSCSGSDCDTLAYTAAVNAIKLCGKNDWRLPTLQELLSLVDNSRFAPAIDINYFPNTQAFDYWTSSPRAIGSGDAWSVYFYYGAISYGSNKNSKYRIRLVRSGQ